MVGALLFPLLAAAVNPNSINDGRIRSLSITNPYDFMASQVVRLGTDDRLRINFDIMGEDREYLRYRLVHCNADWQPSRLLEPEYLDGFNESEVEDYGYSSNTYAHYVNYNIEIPNPEMKPLVSGNYLLQVYPEDAPGDILFQTGFYVTENAVSLSACATSRTDYGFNTEYQQVEAEADVAGAGMINPWQDLILNVVQNNVPQTLKTTVRPLRVEGERVYYAHDPSLIFPAGNEYRRFETVRADYPGMNVDSVGFNGRLHQAWLTPDLPRCGKGYVYDHTSHGRFKIDEYNSTDPDLGADYIVTRFTLTMPEFRGREVYVDGGFNSGLYDRRNLMRYDEAESAYTAEIPLKQGSYNYRYVVVENGGDPNATPLEGNHYETANEYLVMLYLRLPGSRADRLIGVRQIGSGGCE